MIRTRLHDMTLALSLATLAAALWAALRGKRRPVLAWIPISSSNPSQDRRGRGGRGARRRGGRIELVVLIVLVASGLTGLFAHRSFRSLRIPIAPAVQDKADPAQAQAVVLDLDETVIDNGAFQAYLVKRDLSYSDQLWADWVGGHVEEMKLVPGASEFLKGARELGLKVVYISNRPEKLKDKTEEALRRLGVAVHEELLLQKERENKIERRRGVEERYQVVAYVGDSLSDFPGEFELDSKADLKDDETGAQAIQRRRDRVAKHDLKWGENWFVLPNPLYGDFRRLPDPADPLKSLQVMKGSDDAPVAKASLDARSDLTAMIWQQTSAERDALCRQTYRMALTQVRTLVKTTNRPAP